MGIFARQRHVVPTCVSIASWYMVSGRRTVVVVWRLDEAREWGEKKCRKWKKKKPVHTVFKKEEKFG